MFAKIIAFVLLGLGAMVVLGLTFAGIPAMNTTVLGHVAGHVITMATMAYVGAGLVVFWIASKV